MGKTNPRWSRVVVDGINLSGDYREIGDLGLTYPTDDASAQADGVTSSTFGIPELVFGPFNALFNNMSEVGGDTRDGSFTALKDRADRIVSVLLGEGAEPVVGDDCFSSPIQQASFTVSPAGGTVAISMEGNTPGYTDTIPVQVWGKVLAYNQTFTPTTTNNASVDNGAASTAGIDAYLHVTEPSDASYTINIQHSTDDISFATLFFFSSDGTSEGGEQVMQTGSISRYLRVQVVDAGATTNMEATVTVVRRND